MRLRSLVMIAGVAGGGSLVAAQPVNTILFFTASRDGQTWTNHLVALPGDRIQVRAAVTYVGSASAPSAGGLGQIVFQPVVSGWDAGNADGGDELLTNSVLGRAGPSDGLETTPTGRTPPYGGVPDLPFQYGRVTPFTANSSTTSTYLRGHVGTGTAAGLLRIARANVTNWIGVGPTSGAGAANNWNGGGGVSAAQIPNPNRLTSDPQPNPGVVDVGVFRFGFFLSPRENRTLTIFTPANAIGQITTPGSEYGQQNARWFASTQEVSASLRGGVEVHELVIDVIPAPGALPLIGMTVLACRRRRPCAEHPSAGQPSVQQGVAK